jgi:signal transduction histidine kinase
LTITADEGRITQILINLVSNAIKFTPASGSISIRVVPLSKKEVYILREDKNSMKRRLAAQLKNEIVLSENAGAPRVIESDAGLLIEEAIASNEPVHVLFIVKDTGIGISKDTEERLFSPFFQALGTNRKFGGTGLGLSICKKLSELMKGDIGVVSKEGEGSLFWFELPLQINPVSVT